MLDFRDFEPGCVFVGSSSLQEAHDFVSLLREDFVDTECSFCVGL